MRRNIFPYSTEKVESLEVRLEENEKRHSEIMERLQQELKEKEERTAAERTSQLLFLVSKLKKVST